MELKTFPIGSLQTNCYMAWAEGSEKCILIDPGYEPELLLEQVRLQRKTLEAILLTHGHFDHVGGVKQIAAETGCKVYICAEELKQPLRYSDGLHYTDTVAEGDVLALAGLTLQVLHTPGHTPGCVCYLCGDTLFSGDTLFAGTCGRTDLPGGDFKAIQGSLQRLAALEGDLRVLPGHGMASSLDIERRYNPYMQERIW
jgi:glyoxylase-like metal-dependent hydrolase (beta-lactamase superfamily II)